MEKLGYPVNYYDKDANKIEKPATKQVDASISVASIADKYINAIGGKTAIAKLTSISSEGSATMQGMELIIKSQKALGGKLLQEISAMGNTAQKMVFDGKDGYMMMMGNKTPLPEDIKTALLKILRYLKN